MLKKELAQPDLLAFLMRQTDLVDADDFQEEAHLAIRYRLGSRQRTTCQAILFDMLVVHLYQHLFGEAGLVSLGRVTE